MTDNTRQCPYCGETILAVAKKCKYCGEFVEPIPEESTGTKVCPFCGEEILAVAKKCKHCGEFVDKNSSNILIEQVNETELWKRRFRAIDRVVKEGKWWHYRSEFWKTSISERYKISYEIYLSDIVSFLAALFFGPFYYFYKGMWQKGLVYGLICILSCGILWPVFFSFAPYDYYRYSVYGKQW